MATIDAKAYQLQASITTQDSATAETATDLFCLNRGTVLPVEDTTYHRSTDEACRTSDYEQGSPVPIAVSLQHTAGMVADDHALGFWSFWAMHGGAAEAAPVAVNALASATTFEHTRTRGDTTTHLTPTVEALADPANIADGQRNRILHNVLTGLTLSGQRGSVMQLDLEMLGGGNTEDGGTAALTENRNQVFNFGMSHLFTEGSNLGYGSNNTGAFEQTTTGNPFNDAYALTKTNLGGTPVSLTSDLQSISLRPRWTIDQARSYAPGSLNSGDAAIVPSSAGWVNSATGGHSVELEMVFTFTAASTQEDFIDEVRSGSQRSFEYWLVPGIAAGTDASGDAYRGFRATFAGMYPVSWEHVQLAGFGTTGIRVVYRPGFDTTTSQAFRINAAWDESAQMGL